MTDIELDRQLFGFIDNLEQSLGYDPGVRFECDDILLCGVGGSAVSGDFAADCCYAESRVRIHLCKYPALPSWAGPRTLAVISSYSGNTLETLTMYHSAKECGCPVVCVTSGGVLESEATSAGDVLVKLPKNMQPRHAIGYMIGYTLEVIRSAGGPDLGPRMAAFLPSLRRFRDANMIEDGCMAREIAEWLRGKVPVICSDSSMRSVAFRWKTQINENSKFVAFCDSEPDLERTGTDVWTDPSGKCAVIVLIGCDDGMCKGTAKLESLVSCLTDRGMDVVPVRLNGSSTLENMFRAIILGDYVSLYMAEDRGVDPVEVRPVMQLKAKLSKRL